MSQHRIDMCDLATAVPSDARLDVQQRDIVEQGIQMQQYSNTMSAFEYLKSRDVDAHVIKRVLLEPQRRRSPS